MLSINKQSEENVHSSISKGSESYTAQNELDVDTLLSQISLDGLLFM
jgi:hypothetical protein